MAKANDKQISGTHYKKMPIEHWDLAAIFNWDPFQYQITKYAMRWRDKGGIADLEKCLHFTQKYIEIEKLRQSGKLTITLLQETLSELQKEIREEEGQDKPITTGRLDIPGDPRIMVGSTANPFIIGEDPRPDIYGGKRGGPLSGGA